MNDSYQVSKCTWYALSEWAHLLRPIMAKMTGFQVVEKDQNDMVPVSRGSNQLDCDALL